VRTTKGNRGREGNKDERMKMIRKEERIFFGMLFSDGDDFAAAGVVGIAPEFLAGGGAAGGFAHSQGDAAFPPSQECINCK
jgi:hypothetical protein